VRTEIQGGEGGRRSRERDEGEEKKGKKERNAEIREKETMREGGK